MKKQNEKVLVSLAPAIMRLAIKAIRYSKDGYTNDEAKDLGSDLLELAIRVISLATEDK